ncbi:MAG: SDR family oxidoreductase [Bacteroidetes bacterium]|nr:SDR family oxidoreductase [Bacteroidota bacterium]
MFSGKVIWITGASSGIGEELSKQLAKQKAKLILSARRIPELERVQQECLQYTTDVAILQVDLLDNAALPAIAEKAIALFGRIDMLINNGGISQRSSVLETTPDVEQRIMQTNYFSSITLTKAVLPQMEKNGFGNIILMSSITGKIGVPNRSTYCASKHAIIGYFDSLRAELKMRNSPVNINIIMPGYIQTNISIHAVTGDGREQGLMDKGQANGMSVEVCAKKIITAIRKNKKEVLIGRKEILMAYFRRFIPSLYYNLITKVATK